jgi:uncharacterized radical SAM protein YgiQ
LTIADRLKNDQELEDIEGTCRIGKNPPESYIKIPSFEATVADTGAFSEMFKIFMENQDPVSAKGLSQKHGDRYLIHHPPAERLTPKELDEICELDYERGVHPFYEKKGNVKADEVIRFSLVSHRGCYGGCAFCAISAHEGAAVISRSISSIEKEAKRLTGHPRFKKAIDDVGGPAANMYGIECGRKTEKGACKDRQCLYPEMCSNLKPDHEKQIELLNRLRKIPGIKKVYVRSGIRYDMVLHDETHGEKYLETLVSHHISGQLKVAPEHVSPHVLKRMRKPGADKLIRFKKLFEKLNRQKNKKQFLTYYFIAAHPGCSRKDMRKLKDFADRELKMNPEQVQIFTPTPSTLSALMYYTGTDPGTGEKLFVEKDAGEKQRQKGEVTFRKTRNRNKKNVNKK